MQKVVINLVYGTAVRNLKLLVTFFFNLFYMASDTGADTCRNLGCRNVYQVVAHAGTFSCGNCNVCKWHEQAISTYHLQKLCLMNIHRVDFIVVDDRAKARTGEGNLCMWIFSLQKICVHAGGKSVFAEIIQSEEGCKSNTAHTAANGAFLCIQTVWEDSFVSCQMQCLVFVGIVGFLKNGYVVSAALMQICILIGVHRVYFQSDDFEIFAGDLTGLSDIFHT